MTSAPDDVLITACAELEAMAMRHDRLCAPYFAAGVDEPPHVGEAIKRDGPRLDALRDFIACTPATTLAGLQAKARAILADAPFNIMKNIDADHQHAWSLVQDVAALRIASSA